MSAAKQNVCIFDTTLRDGEQSPGCSMNLKEKLLVAAQLELLRVDVIEAGFAASSPGDFESVREVARLVQQAGVATLCRCLPKDIDAGWQAVREARRPRLHLFLATSPLHMQYKLKMSPDAVYEQAVTMVQYARNLCPEVEFSCEDASRSETDFMYRVVEGVIRAGASVVNLPDTVGYAVPEQYAAMIRGICEHVPNVGEAMLSVHCHNDLGLAVANSLAAVQAGARQVECTLNGIGERAGNAALEEVVMALRTRPDYFTVASGVETAGLYNASRSVITATGSRVQANKAIVGENAFAHEAGIHQHGMMAHAGTYEIMTPESIGIPRNRMVLGKHSGRHAFDGRLTELGFHFDAVRLQTLFTAFKALADRKKTVTDADIEALARGSAGQAEEVLQLERFVVQSGNDIPASCTVFLRKDGELSRHSATGDGPIDAAFKAIEGILGFHLTLETFTLSSVTGGEDAQGEASVKVRHGERMYHGHGLSTDVIEASIKAYLSAVNALLGDEKNSEFRIQKSE
ncbi:MAG: 2-isopropylmalate synthase [Kiritimatiellia bacterium]